MGPEGGPGPELEPAPEDAVKELKKLAEKCMKQTETVNLESGIEIGFFRELGGEHFVRILLLEPYTLDFQRAIEEESVPIMHIDDISVQGIDREAGVYDYTEYTIYQQGDQLYVEKIPFRGEIGKGLDRVAMTKEEERAYREKYRKSGDAVVSELRVDQLQSRLMKLEPIISGDEDNPWPEEKLS